MTSTDDARDEFMGVLEHVGIARGWLLEQLLEDPRFLAKVALHGEHQVRKWLLMFWIRTAGEAECLRRQQLLHDEIARMIEATDRSRLELSTAQWHRLYERHGLELEGPSGNPALLDSDWLSAQTLQRLVDYCMRTPIHRQARAGRGNSG